jgi:hypothetical protein
VIYDFIAIPDAEIPKADEPIYQHMVFTYASEANKTASMCQAVPDDLLDFKPNEKTKPDPNNHGASAIVGAAQHPQEHAVRPPIMAISLAARSYWHGSCVKERRPHGSCVKERRPRGPPRKAVLRSDCQRFPPTCCNP